MAKKAVVLRPDVLSQTIALDDSTRNFHRYTYGENFKLYIPRSAFPHDAPPRKLYLIVKEIPDE